MARLVQGLRCVVNQSFMVARVAGPRNIFQHRCMHHGLSSTGLIAPSLVKSVQVISIWSILICPVHLISNLKLKRVEVLLCRRFRYQNTYQSIFYFRNGQWTSDDFFCNLTEVAASKKYPFFQSQLNLILFSELRSYL